MDKRVPAVEEENRSEGVPEPKGMIVYDPDHPLYEHRHVCFVLRKVSDALHGYTEAESADTEEY